MQDSTPFLFNQFRAFCEKQPGHYQGPQLLTSRLAGGFQFVWRKPRKIEGYSVVIQSRQPQRPA